MRLLTILAPTLLLLLTPPISAIPSNSRNAAVDSFEDRAERYDSSSYFIDNNDDVVEPASRSSESFFDGYDDDIRLDSGETIRVFTNDDDTPETDDNTPETEDKTTSKENKTPNKMYADLKSSVSWNSTYDDAGTTGSVKAVATSMEHCETIKKLAMTDAKVNEGFCDGLPTVHVGTGEFPLGDCLQGYLKNYLACVKVMKDKQEKYDFEFSYDASKYAGTAPTSTTSAPEPSETPSKKERTYAEYFGIAAMKFVKAG